VLKANWGRFAFNPGVNLADAVNPNTSTQYEVWTWDDINGDRVFQSDERVGSQPTQKFGGTVNTSLDPDLENSYSDEASVFVERALLADLGVRVGYVWKKDNNGWQQMNDGRPHSAYNVPVTITDPGPDGSIATVDDNGTLNLFNLDDLSRANQNVVRNVEGYEGDYNTIELAANKRFSNRWSMNASFSHTWTHEFHNTYFGNRFASVVQNSSLFGVFPNNPNEFLEHEFTNWNAKFSGTIDAGWGMRVTPVLKMQSGVPYGRYINVAGCTASVTTNCLNYGAQLVLVEPIGTRRQDTVSVVDFRVEKQLRFADRARAGLFFDVFNALNSNTAVNETWLSGTRFERATTVLGPRIAKFGVKFDW
jgi:hypothetical protein